MFYWFDPIAVTHQNQIHLKVLKRICSVLKFLKLFLREAFVQMGLDCSRSLVGQESYDPLFHNSTFLPFETSGKRMFYSGRLVHNTFEDWIGSSFASVQPAGRSSIRFLSNFPQFAFLAVESEDGQFHY